MKKTPIELQLRLAEEGFYRGNLDGVWGPFSKFAMKLFQAMFGIEQTGELDDETEKELFPETIGERSNDELSDASGEGTDHKWPRYSDIKDYYGLPGADLVRLTLPYEMKLAWDTSTVIDSFFCHRKVHSSLYRIFTQIDRTFSAGEKSDLGLDMYGGCYNKRRMRGGTKWSTHAWGVAVDFDPARNRLSWGADRARLARPDAERFWQIWEREGWVSLGRSKGYDFMHVQAVIP